ncbi:MAG: LSM domain-containing protein [Candidatus Micrarchaeia archaeon]|jgi:small nuclear ribonucleoprotein
MQDRPFDLLNKSVGQSILVRLKNGVSIRGKLISFDMHMNIVMEDAEELDQNGSAKARLGTILLRGGNIFYLSPST